MGLTAMIRSPTRTLLSALIGKCCRPTKHRQFHCKNQTFSRIGTFVHRFQGLTAFPVWPARFSYTTTSVNPPRDSLDFDVVIVGAGPAGLAAAIRLRQLCQNGGPDLSVCVLEKGSELGEAPFLTPAILRPRR